VDYFLSPKVISAVIIYHPHAQREGGIVFSIEHDNSLTVRDIIPKFSGQHPMLERVEMAIYGYTAGCDMSGYWG